MIRFNIIKCNPAYIFFVVFLVSSVFIGCEEPYTPSTIESQQEYVVEGYVEAGNQTNPVFVMISRSIPYLSTVSPDKFAELFVKNAEVTVNDGDKSVRLTQICLNDLPEEIKKMVAEALNLDPENLTADICIYGDILNQIIKEEGRTYTLDITVEGKQLKATTTIPIHVPIHDLVWMDPPGTPNDTLARLLATIQDPLETMNYYRYFTADVGEGFVAPFNSVVDDAIFNGKTFEFPLQKAERRGGDFSPETFGLYKRGSKVVIKWCSLDKQHFNFWNTRDFAANSGGPFSSYTRISTNIEGGLGIWGGYAVSVDTLEVPVK